MVYPLVFAAAGTASKLAGADLNRRGNQKALEAMQNVRNAERERQRQFLAQLDDKTLNMLMRQSMDKRIAQEVAGAQTDARDIEGTGAQVANAAEQASGQVGAGRGAARMGGWRAGAMARALAQQKGADRFNFDLGNYTLDRSRLARDSARSRNLMGEELQVAAGKGQAERDLAQWLDVLGSGSMSLGGLI